MAFALLSIFVVQIALGSGQTKGSAQDELIVFHLGGKTLITERHGKITAVYTDVPDIVQNKMLKSYLAANFCAMGKTGPLKNVFAFDKTQMLVIDSMSIYPSKAHPDILLLIQSPKINLQRLLNFSRPKAIIADGSNFKSYIAKWRETCRKEKIPFHYTGEKGFYLLKN